MKIKIIYSGGKKKEKEEDKNPQEADPIKINLELSLLGDRNVIYESEKFLSTFEMLKEQLYHYITKNNINININNFSYNDIHNVERKHIL